MALTEQVLMPGTDYQEIADQTRTLDGTSETLKSGEVAAKLQAATTTVTAQTAQINALIEQANSLPEAGSGGGGGDEWELIKYIEVPEGTEETNALTIDKDENGDPFSLKKARLFTRFAKYEGESTIPTYSFTMVNGISGGAQSPYVYTSGLPIPSKTGAADGCFEVDLSLDEFQIEKVARYPGAGARGAITPYFGERRLNNAEYITSIGGTSMLIYPGCQFWLFGVRDTPASDRSLGITSATVGQIAKISAVDAAGRPTAWEAVDLPSGESPKEWTKIIDLDFSEEDATDIISITDLPNVTEFYFLGSSLENSETTISGFSLTINSKLIVESGQLLRIGKSGSALTQRASAKFNGLFWDVLCSSQTTYETIRTIGTAYTQLTCARDVGSAETLKLQIPTHLPMSGTLEVWAR